MRKKDKEAFLRSITGTKPIQKKDNIKKNIKIDVNNTDKAWVLVANAPLVSNFFLLKKIGK